MRARVRARALTVRTAEGPYARSLTQSESLVHFLSVRVAGWTARYCSTSSPVRCARGRSTSAAAITAGRGTAERIAERRRRWRAIVVRVLAMRAALAMRESKIAAKGSALDGRARMRKETLYLMRVEEKLIFGLDTLGRAVRPRSSRVRS